MIKLINGDCLEVMDKIIAKNVKVDAIITDPPYGTTKCKWDSVIPFELMWERLHKLIKNNGAIVLFGSEPFSSTLRMSNIKNYKYDWVWDKVASTGFLNSKKQPLRCHELITVFYKKQCTYNYIKTTGHQLKQVINRKNYKLKYIQKLVKMCFINQQNVTQEVYRFLVETLKRIMFTQHRNQLNLWNI